MEHVQPLAIIPARGGSRRLPGKNLCLLKGRPLLWWTLDFCLRAQLAGVLLSDSAEVLSSFYDWSVSNQDHRIWPMYQSPGAAWDQTPMLSAVLDGLGRCGHRDPRLVVLLQPTTPYRTREQLEEVLSHIGPAVSAYSCGADGRPDGAFYAARSDWIWATARLLPEPSCAVRNAAPWHVDIDTAEDLARAALIEPLGH